MLDICVVGFGGGRTTTSARVSCHLIGGYGYLQLWGHFTRLPLKDPARRGSLLFAGEQLVPRLVTDFRTVSLGTAVGGRLTTST